MKTKVRYDSEEERDTILDEYSHLFLIEEQNISEGDFLIFSDTEPQPPIIYVNVPEVEFEELKQESTDLMLAIAELAEADAQEKTEMQLAIAELAEIIAGGAQDGEVIL
ncbi:hypothetical protein [Sporosarcina sp. FSL K6-2383]|uniref:hypothetical protein n=1 Tax=Sporosarcina sp. FSL K6-2383 TaxID=2921556 RepID=UPI00315B30E3